VGEKTDLKAGRWDAITKASFKDLPKLSNAAFILRLIYTTNRNPYTNLCELHDFEVCKITGWNHETVQFARELLLKKRYIIHKKRGLFFIPNMRKIRTSQTAENPQKNSGKSAPHPAENPQKNSGKSAIPPHYSETDINNNKGDAAAVLNPAPQKAPPSLPELLELHLKITGAQPNEGLRRAILNHLNDCHVSGWRLADMERVIRGNQLFFIKKNIYELLKPLSELDRAKKATQDKLDHLKDIEKRGYTCGNCKLWDKDHTRGCNGDFAFWYQICKHENKFEKKI